MSHSSVAGFTNPGSLRLNPRFKTIMIVFTLIGVLSFGLALMTHHGEAAWSALLINHFYFMSLAVGGLFFTAIQWATNAMWSAPVRRISESFTAYLPFVLISFIVLVFGLHEIYEWTHLEVVVKDHILSGKTSYLNTPFFIIRTILAVGLWVFFARKLVGNSIAQDSMPVGSEASNRIVGQNRKLAPAFLILFAMSFTLLSFDLIMSLQPHWFSTIFGVYCFAGLFYSVLAMTAAVTIVLRRKGVLNGIINDNHIHDLGKFMFAFTVFWAYIGFSQFMLIWYANLPEETGYYILRFQGHWKEISIFLLVGKFLVPFFFLLPRDAKRNEKRVFRVAIFMLVAQWIDLMWMVQPVFFESGPHFGWPELGITLGFIGVFGLLVSRFLSKHNVIAVGDPRLSESLNHHHQ